MKKTIDVDILDLDEDDTICGYRIKDLLATARVLQRENITVIDLRKFVNNLEFAFKIIKNDLEKQFDDQMSYINNKVDWWSDTTNKGGENEQNS